MRLVADAAGAPDAIARSRADLVALIDRVDRDPGATMQLFRPQGDLAKLPLRRSSVLILFGALDRRPAHPAVSSVPVELDVLLTRRSPTMRHHPGQIAFPGGGAEPEDSGPEQTALREAVEETGLEASGVEILGTLPDAHVYVSNNMVTPVIGWWHSPSDVAADHAESVEVFRAPVAELLDPSARGTSVLRRGRQTFRGPAFRLSDKFGGHIVWGFTGMMLAALFDEVGWSLDWDPDREFAIEL